MLIYSPGLITECRKVFQWYNLMTLTDEASGIKGKNLYRLRRQGPFYVYLNASGASRRYSESGEPSGERDWILHPFYRQPKDRALVWLGFRMRFDVVPASGLALGHVSVQLARGEQDIRPLLRAEWDCREPGEGEGIHSQPHWHVHPARLPDSLELDPIEGKWAAVQEHVHLAMCARWHNSVGAMAHRATPRDEQELAGWLKNLLQYLSVQIAYSIQRVGFQSLTGLAELRD